MKHSIIVDKNKTCNYWDKDNPFMCGHIPFRYFNNSYPDKIEISISDKRFRGALKFSMYYGRLKLLNNRKHNEYIAWATLEVEGAILCFPMKKWIQDCLDPYYDLNPVIGYIKLKGIDNDKR